PGSYCGQRKTGQYTCHCAKFIYRSPDHRRIYRRKNFELFYKRNQSIAEKEQKLIGRRNQGVVYVEKKTEGFMILISAKESRLLAHHLLSRGPWHADVQFHRL